MQPQKSILTMLGVLALLIIFIGCSANPTSSSQTVPLVDNSDTGSDNASTEPADDGNGNQAGHSTDVNTDIPKYDQGDDDDDEEVLPAPGN